MKDLAGIATFFADDQLHVVVEVPKGAQVKTKYDACIRAFKYSRPLSKGLSYPYDWGFIPSTSAEDGDPLDALVIHDGSTSPGTVITCRLLGVLKVEQTQGDGDPVRNDRYLCCPVADPNLEHVRNVDDLPAGTKRELERFFVAAVDGTGKKLRLEGWEDPDGAFEGIRKGARAYARKKGK